ncbi:MAG: hypothetical protein FJX69_01530 [Alphaproteobacteria bacterium]|nr:hypothetical protein [Alphaproteobacteria bacterium]
MDLPRIGAPIVPRLAAAALAATLSACAAPAPGPAPAATVQGEAYFAGIDDLPLAPGLVERPGERTSFETVAGRIEARGAAGRASREAVAAFYAQTLPQLGWQPQRDGGYARGGERLGLEFSSPPEDAGTLLLRILITPG